jgi:hypothetical protein
VKRAHKFQKKQPYKVEGQGCKVYGGSSGQDPRTGPF